MVEEVGIVETYDILMLIVLAGAGIFGAFKGFAWQLASIASILISYFVAYRFREPLSDSIVAEPPWDRFLAMLILFVGSSLVVWVAFNMVRRTIDRMKLKEFDRQIGGLFGLLKGGLYCTLITLFSVTLLGDSIREKIVASKSGLFIARNLDRSESVIPVEIHEFLRPYLDRLDSEFQGIPTAAETAVTGRLVDGAGWSQAGASLEAAAGRFLRSGGVPGPQSQPSFQPQFQPQQPFQPQPGWSPQSQPSSLFPSASSAGPVDWR
jgi:membrane protein required for colicin V production